jgi:ABC-type tungstate transport system substrate-binding protein
MMAQLQVFLDNYTVALRVDLAVVKEPTLELMEAHLAVLAQMADLAANQAQQIVVAEGEQAVQVVTTAAHTQLVAEVAALVLLL